MYFNVSQLMKESSGSTRIYEVDDMARLTEDSPASRVAGIVRMLRTDKGIWVSAPLDTEIICTCSRCLAEYRQSIHMEIEEEFFPVVDVNTGVRLHYPTEFEEDFYLDQNHILDLTEAARQYAEMSVPMKPICEEACAGICLTCGADLNETTCSCDQAVRDPRWGPLLEMVSAKEGNS